MADTSYMHTTLDTLPDPAPRAGLPAPLAALVAGAGPAPLRASLERAFGDLTRLLAGASLIDSRLLEDCTPAEALSLFARFEQEAWSLLEFLRDEAARAEGRNASLYDALDGICYALRHELRRVFEDELTGLETLRNPSSVKVQLAHANDLLRNCIEQTTVTLAQVFDPSLDGPVIFDNYRDRLEQSLALCKELWVLVQRVRRARRERDRASIVAFVEGLKKFRHTSMHYLMYKDWHGFEAHVRRVLGTKDAGELAPVLEEFDAYLEALLGHVRRRAVLLHHASEQ